MKFLPSCYHSNEHGLGFPNMQRIVFPLEAIVANSFLYRVKTRYRVWDTARKIGLIAEDENSRKMGNNC